MVENDKSVRQYSPLLLILLVYPYGIGLVAREFVADALVFVTGLVTLFLLHRQGYGDILVFRKPMWKTVRRVILAFLCKLCWAVIVYHFLSSTKNEEALNSWSYTGVQLFLYNLYLLVYGPICEELVFRGYMMRSLAPVSHLQLDVLCSACLFSLGHVLPTGWVLNDFLVYLGSGLIYAILFKKSATIYPVIILHIIWNSLMLL